MKTYRSMKNELSTKTMGSKRMKSKNTATSRNIMGLSPAEGVAATRYFTRRSLASLAVSIGLLAGGCDVEGGREGPTSEDREISSHSADLLGQLARDVGHEHLDQAWEDVMNAAQVSHDHPLRAAKSEALDHIRNGTRPNWADDYDYNGGSQFDRMGSVVPQDAPSYNINECGPEWRELSGDLLVDTVVLVLDAVGFSGGKAEAEAAIRAEDQALRDAVQRAFNDEVLEEIAGLSASEQAQRLLALVGKFMKEAKGAGLLSTTKDAVLLSFRELSTFEKVRTAVTVVAVVTAVFAAPEATVYALGTIISIDVETLLQNMIENSIKVHECRHGPKIQTCVDSGGSSDLCKMSDYRTCIERYGTDEPNGGYDHCFRCLSEEDINSCVEGYYREVRMNACDWYQVGNAYPYEGRVGECADWCEQRFNDDSDNTKLYLSTCPQDYWPEFGGFWEESCRVSGYESDQELGDCITWCKDQGIGVTCGGDYKNHLYYQVCSGYVWDEGDIQACLNYCIPNGISVDDCVWEFEHAGCPGSNHCNP